MTGMLHITHIQVEFVVEEHTKCRARFLDSAKATKAFRRSPFDFPVKKA